MVKDFNTSRWWDYNDAKPLAVGSKQYAACTEATPKAHCCKKQNNLSLQSTARCASALDYKLWGKAGARSSAVT